jgi:hypothetical protein
MKFIKAPGVPCGSRCSNMWLVFLVHPNIIIVNQTVKDRGKVTVRCAVAEKICGYRARKFKGKMVMNIKITNISVPFSGSPRVYFTSFLNVLIIFCRINDVVWLSFQIFVENGITAISMISQAIDIVDVEGSNVENKLVIIFIFSHLVRVWPR